jgi:hypothetical protein
MEKFKKRGGEFAQPPMVGRRGILIDSVDNKSRNGLQILMGASRSLSVGSNRKIRAVPVEAFPAARGNRLRMTENASRLTASGLPRPAMREATEAEPNEDGTTCESSTFALLCNLLRFLCSSTHLSTVCLSFL